MAGPTASKKNLCRAASVRFSGVAALVVVKRTGYWQVKDAGSGLALDTLKRLIESESPR